VLSTFSLTLGGALLLSGCGGSGQSAGKTPSAVEGPPDLAAAKKEGTLVVWHGDQEADVVKFLAAFKQKTGIDATQVHINPGEALPKLLQESKAGLTDVDVYNSANLGVLYQFHLKDLLMQYVSPESKAYAPEYLSNPVGLWTTYYVNVGPMIYIPTMVKSADAPKTWTDLLDPKWKDQIEFENSTSGTQYTWWYMLRDKLPSDFFDQLAKQRPTGYGSSTAMMQDLYNGNKKIGGKISSFQYSKSKRQNQPIAAVYPEIGTPAVTQGTTIIKSTVRPNASKAFIDYLTSQEGQKVWNDLQGSYSARTDVKTEWLPPIDSLKLLIPDPKNIKDYSSPDLNKKFQALWNQVTGL